MRNVSKYRIGREGFALQIVLPICLLLIGTASMAVVASYQMRINATHTSIQSVAMQMQTATMRQAAFIIAADLSNTNFSSFNAQLTNAFALGTTNQLGNMNQNAQYNAVLVNSNSGVAAVITNDFISSLATSYTTNTYPQTRLALVKPGTTFISKVFPYQLITSYSQADNLSTNGGMVLTTNMTAKTNNITIYEVPGQFGLEGGSISLASNTGGTVVGSSVNLASGASVAGNVVGDTNVSYGAGASINGGTLNQNSSIAAGQAERLANTANSGFTGQFAVGQQGGAAVLMQIGDRTTDTNAVGGTNYPVPKIFERPAPVANGTAPTMWDVYSHPYYSAGTRVYSTNGIPMDPTNPNQTVICQTTYPNGANGANGAGASFSARTNENATNPASFLTFSTQTGSCAPTGEALIANITVTNIPTVNGARTLFIDLITTGGDSGSTRMGTIVALQAAGDLGGIPLSIVSANPIAFLSDFNTNNAPCSVLAPVVYSSLTPTPGSMLSLIGIRGTSAHTGALDTSTLGNGVNAAAVAASTNNDITNTTQLPPILLKNWLIVSTPPQ